MTAIAAAGDDSWLVVHTVVEGAGTDVGSSEEEWRIRGAKLCPSW